MKMMGFGLNSWTTGDAVDVLTDVRVASEAGYRFIELRDWKIERYLAQGSELGVLRDRVEQSDLRVLSVNTLDDSTLQTGAGFDRVVARCHTLCAWAEALGSPYVIVGPSYLPEGGGVSAEAIHENTVTALVRYVEVAAEHGVRIAFEFHGYSRCSINKLAAATAVLDEIGDARVGLVIDAFHFYVGGSSFRNLEELDHSRLFIVHLADAEHNDRTRLGKPNRVFPGDGVLPLKDLVRSIRRTQFEGPYSLELFRPEYWAMDPLVVARRGLQSMKRFV